MKLDREPVPGDRLWLDYGRGCIGVSFDPVEGMTEAVILVIVDDHKLIFATRARFRAKR